MSKFLLDTMLPKYSQIQSFLNSQLSVASSGVPSTSTSSTTAAAIGNHLHASSTIPSSSQSTASNQHRPSTLSSSSANNFINKNNNNNSNNSNNNTNNNSSNNLLNNNSSNSNNSGESPLGSSDGRSTPTNNSVTAATNKMYPYAPPTSMPGFTMPGLDDKSCRYKPHISTTYTHIQCSLEFSPICSYLALARPQLNV